MAARAGHARPSTTSDIYAHFIKSSDKTAAAVVDKVFNSDTPEEPPIQKMAPIVQTEPTATLPVDTVSDPSIEEFRKTKADVKRLGFNSYEEYEDYLDYIERKKERRTQKSNDSCM